MINSKRLVISLALLVVLGMLPLGRASERFTDNGDGTVTDHRHNLMWAQTDNHGDIGWHQAQKWVRYTLPYTLGTQYADWRLPTLEELQSLVVEEPTYETDCGQWVHIVEMIRLSCGWIWTSESDAIAPTARIFNFNHRYHYTVRKAHRRGYRALAVRDVHP